MFFVKELEKRIDLEPQFFHCDAEAYIRDRLYREVEGTNSGVMLIIAVMQIDEISEPKVVPSSGYAEYNVSYRAIVWKPFKGEVVDGMVSSVMANGVFVDVGGLMMPDTMKKGTDASTPSFYDEDGMTVQRGSHIRLRIKGVRMEIGKMFAIGSIKDDYLGTIP